MWSWSAFHLEYCLKVSSNLEQALSLLRNNYLSLSWNHPSKVKAGFLSDPCLGKFDSERIRVSAVKKKRLAK